MHTPEFAFERKPSDVAGAIARQRLASPVVQDNAFGTLASQGDRPRRVRVQLDGRAIAPAAAGEDVRDGVVTVRRQRLYRLVKLGALGEHVLTLRLERGVSAFAFTFG